MKIHAIGKQDTNYPWGFETKVIAALTHMGHNIISTDYVKQPNELTNKIDANLTLVFKGDRIAPEYILNIENPVVLWWAELIGTVAEFDLPASQARQILSYNIGAFDHVFVHDAPTALVCEEMGAMNVSVAPTCIVNHDVHFKIDGINKKHDIGFVGFLTDRRKAIIEELQKVYQVAVREIKDPIKMNEFFNECKIVLNLHLSDLKNTESRVGEVMGSGSFLLSEELTTAAFEDNKHLGIFKNSDFNDLCDHIDYYLKNEKEREAIAAAGYEFIKADYSMEGVLKKMLEMDFKKCWPTSICGMLYDKDDLQTNDLQKFYEAVG